MRWGITFVCVVMECTVYRSCRTFLSNKNSHKTSHGKRYFEDVKLPQRFAVLLKGVFLLKKKIKATQSCVLHSYPNL